MREINFDRAYYLKEYTTRMRARTLLDEDCPLLQPFEQAMNDRTMNAHTIHDLNIGALVDTTFNNIWALAATSLLEFKGSAEYYDVAGGTSAAGYRMSDSYVIARERARNILDMRSTILDLLESLEDELVQQNFGYIWSRIRSRIRSLDGFEGVYNRDLGHGYTKGVRTAYMRPSERQKGKKGVVSIAYQQGQQNVSNCSSDSRHKQD
jgi:hypothetical protein